MACFIPLEQHALENENSCENTKITFYLATSGGQNFNPYLNVFFIFSTPVLIRHLRQLKTAEVVFLVMCDSSMNEL